MCTTYEKLCIMGNSFIAELDEEMAEHPENFYFDGIGEMRSVEAYQCESILDCETETEVFEHNMEAIMLIDTWLSCFEPRPRYDLVDVVQSDLQKADIKEGIDVCLIATENNETKLCIFGYNTAKETARLIYTL